MRFPAINTQPKRSVTVPDFSGGMNLRDGITNIKDNQLSEVFNMWYKDGALRTRPNIDTSFKLDYSSEMGFSGNALLGTLEVYRYESTNEYQLIYIRCPNMQRIDFYWCGENEPIKLPSITPSAGSVTVSFAVEYQGDIYVYLSDKTIYKYVDNASKWTKISEDDMYVPIILTHCRPSGNLKGEWIESTNYESYNLLGNKYRIIGSTVNPSLFNETRTAHAMMYKLPQSIRKSKGSGVVAKGTIVTAAITYSNGNSYTHSVTYSADAVIATESAPQGDNLIMVVSGGLNGIYFEKIVDGENKGTAQVDENDYIEDNLEITAPYNVTATEKNKVFGMTRSVWFGGTSSGLENGTRIFLCGNTSSKEKNLIQWSALNNPLYFPSENNAYVGDSQQSVTAFGKQGEKLVIFKENETWYTYYAQNTDITASNLISQNIIDIQSQGVYFPLVLINGHIGCDCPKTVRLCRNRLVWAHSSGRVYTLVSESNYTERSIYEVSEMISERLQGKRSALRTATSADWNGYYVLAMAENKYLMDYNSYGYTNVYSYTKTEDANINIPWYWWNTKLTEDARNNGVINAGNGLVCYSRAKSGSAINDNSDSFTGNAIFFGTLNGESGVDTMYATSEDGSSNYQKPIENYAVSKFFEFGVPNIYKNIHSLGLSFGFNGGNEIQATIITEDGTEQTGIVLEGDNNTVRGMPEFIKSVVWSPAIFSVLRMGVKFYCEGLMIIDNINIIYRLTGRAR